MLTSTILANANANANPAVRAAGMDADDSACLVSILGGVSKSDVVEKAC